MAQDSPPSLWTLFKVFLKLGSVAFGGYLAMVAMVERELVERQKLIKHEELLDGVALATTLPGPVAVNVVSYIGFKLRGLAGALVSILAVILPSFLLLVALAEAYARFGEIEAISNIFRGFLPAVVAIIVAVAWKMARQNISHPLHWAIAGVTLLVFIWIGGFLTAIGLIVASGILGYFAFIKHKPTPVEGQISVDAVMKVRGPLMLGAAIIALSLGLGAMQSQHIFVELWTRFSGMSLVMFGGGYVFIPMMQEVVVQQQQWMSAREFADAIALGQVTPGPIMISATFIGYRVASFLGAAIATVAIFLPSAVLMMVCAGLHQRVKESPIVKAAYKGIRPCIVGLIFSAAVALAQTADHGVVGVVIFTLALVATVRFKLDTAYVIPGAGLLGFIGFGLLGA